MTKFPQGWALRRTPIFGDRGAVAIGNGNASMMLTSSLMARNISLKAVANVAVEQSPPVSGLLSSSLTVTWQQLLWAACCNWLPPQHGGQRPLPVMTVHHQTGACPLGWTQ
uniref:Uncharacterized protein n=1 Tax=Romanomermis culicivorax TaxID=13658 RepID=A0A915IE66_ROMCU